MYLLVTPVRNEAENLPQLLEAVAGQSMTPSLWVIVDHSSTDNSAEIIAGASHERGWVELVRAEATQEYGYFSHAVPVRKGFEAAISRAAENGIDYRYLGILDADIIPEKAYFEKLAHFLEDSPELGIVSGQLFIVEKGREKPEGMGAIPRGGCRLYRRKCFEDIGGHTPIAPAWETLTDILAQHKGWQISRLYDAKAIHKRKTNTRKGLWHGFWMRGKGYYYLNYHPLSAFLTGLYFTTKAPFYQGGAYICGYFNSLMKREEQIQDPVIRDYFWGSFGRFAGRQGAWLVGIFQKMSRT